MKKIKVLGIAPYQGMRDMMMNIAAERDDVEFTAFVGDLNKGAEIVRELEIENFDAILSRGGTALAIKEITDTVVFGITVSYYDVLNAIKLAENFDGKFAIVGFSDISEFARQLCKILQYDIHIVTAESEEDAKKIIDDLNKQNYSLIVGDVISTRYAQEIGMASMLITSGSESIRFSFDQVVNICRYYATFKKENTYFKMNQSVKKENLLVYDENGVLLFHSVNKDKTAIETISKRLLSSLRIRKQLKIVKEMNGKAFLVTGYTNALKDKIYFIFNAIPIASADNSPFSSITLQNKQEVSHYFFLLFKKSNAHKELKKTMEKYSKTAFPILIAGESGTGKDKMAYLIHSNSNYDNYPCYTVDCSMITEQELSDFLHNENSPFYESNTTFYFRLIDSFSDIMLDKLFKFIKRENFSKRNRLLFSTIANTNEKPSFLQTYLKFHLECLVIKLPPLRQCIDDIPGIANFYIHDFNVAHGKQIAGIEPEALSLLQGFAWPNNLNQFKHALTDACVLTEPPYISVNTISKILREEHAPCAVNCNLHHTFNLNQSLTAITYDIVQAILSEENMTYTKAAKRLGISRTTLWRILNAKPR